MFVHVHAKAMHERNRRIFARTAGILLYCLLFLSYQEPKTPRTPLPAGLAEQLGKYRTRDSLTAWIYCQIQWVAAAPATRAGQLINASAGAWRNPRSNEEVQAWLDLLINEGYALLVSGDIVHSTDAYTAAWQWARQNEELVEGSLVLENILKPLGNNYTRLGDYEQALFIHRKALAIASSLKDRDAVAGTYSNLANTASNMHQPGQSLDYCRLGLEVAEKHSALSGLLLSEQADACEQLQQTGAARAIIQKSIAVLETAKTAGPQTRYWLLMAYQQAGDIWSAQPLQALKFYNKALALQTRFMEQQGATRKREQAKLYLRLGELYSRSGQVSRAAYWLDRCLSELVPGEKIGSLKEDDLYAENTLLDLLFVRAGLYGEDKTDDALHLYRLCFATEKELRNEFITGSSKERSVSDSRMRYETAIHTAWQAWKRTGQNKYRQAILGFMESSKSQLLLEELLQQRNDRLSGNPSDSLGNRIHLLERALIYYRKEALQAGKTDSMAGVKALQEKQTEWDLAQLYKRSRKTSSATLPLMNPFSADSLPVLLRNGQSIRSFFAGSQAVYTIEWNNAGISFAERLACPGQWQDSLRQFIREYFETGANHMINKPSAYCREAYAIYTRLFGEHPLRAGGEYILLPDGPLSLLPVDALVTAPSCPPSPEDWPFVIRQAKISYAWSLRTLEEQDHDKVHNKGFSGFFLSGNNSHSPLLGAITLEKDGITHIIANGNWYTNEQATATTFKKALQGSAVIHISSHAFTGKDTLDSPHIELYDEPFYLFELKGLGNGPDLVVLSACRTGDGRMVTGEGVQSLARAFTAGGARAVVAGWWNVNDAAAGQLMQGFYSSLVSGQDAAGALRQSKLGWLNDKEVSYLHKLPYYWAALNYLGNPAPLNTGDWMKPSSSNRTSSGGHFWGLKWALASVVLVVIMLLILRYRLTRSFDKKV